MPGYSRAVGYTPSLIPTAVGARYFFPDPDFDDDTDQAKPAATGNKWDGGKRAYQLRVVAAAKDVGKEQGLKPRDIRDIEKMAETPARVA